MEEKHQPHLRYSFMFFMPVLIRRFMKEKSDEWVSLLLFSSFSSFSYSCSVDSLGKKIQAVLFGSSSSHSFSLPKLFCVNFQSWTTFFSPSLLVSSLNYFISISCRPLPHHLSFPFSFLPQFQLSHTIIIRHHYMKWEGWERAVVKGFLNLKKRNTPSNPIFTSWAPSFFFFFKLRIKFRQQWYWIQHEEVMKTRRFEWQMKFLSLSLSQHHNDKVCFRISSQTVFLCEVILVVFVCQVVNNTPGPEKMLCDA